MLLVDVSKASSSAQAIGMVEDFIKHSTDIVPGEQLELHTGHLLLTQGILIKVKQMLKGAGLQLETLYSSVPQTQQAALDEGLFVKEKPQSIQNTFATRPTLPMGGRESLKEAVQASSPDIALPFEGPAALAPPAESSVKTLPDEGVSSFSDEIASALPTLYLKQTLRSGKVVRFDGNIIIIGDVHAGSEISAVGDIAVWGELRGIAHAGVQGNYRAEIRALKIEAIQLRIADYIARRPDRIYYHKEAGSSNVMAPEIAKVADGEIKIIQEVIGR